MTCTVACWTTRSATVGMPSGRVRPSGFGISTRRTGGGTYRSADSSLRRSEPSWCSASDSKAAIDWPSTTGRSGVGPDLSPCERQVGRIGDGLQQLAHGQHLLGLSLSPHTVSRSGGQSRRPARRSGLVPFARNSGACFEAWSRSAPSPDTPPSQAGGPPAHVRAAGQRALPRLQHYYEPSDSSKGVGLPFPHGLWRRLPDLHRSAGRAHLDHRPPALTGLDVVCEGLLGTLRGLPGSLHKRCRHGSPKSPPGAPPSRDRSSPMSGAQGRGLRFPCSRAGRHSRRPSIGSLTFKPWLCLRPLRTPGHPGALGISYRTSTTKAREGLSPPR